jgi:hypothetical protein
MTKLTPGRLLVRETEQTIDGAPIIIELHTTQFALRLKGNPTPFYTTYASAYWSASFTQSRRPASRLYRTPLRRRTQKRASR